MQDQFEDFLARVVAQGTGLGRVGDREHRAKAHRLAEDLGVLHLFIGEQAEQRFEPRAGAAVLVAVQQGEAEEDPARMVEAAEVGAGGVVETGLGPVIGVGAPRRVMQQAGGLDRGADSLATRI